MQRNTHARVAYHLLAKGVHLSEIQRFADAAIPAVDPDADTIPAPPPSRDLLDPETLSTEPWPPTSILESEDFQDARVELVEAVGCA